jgi:hypothetical protein
MPNAVQSEISVVNTINLKLTDKQYFAAILANQILGRRRRKIILNLRENTDGHTALILIGFGKYVENSFFNISTKCSNRQFCS